MRARARAKVEWWVGGREGACAHATHDSSVSVQLKVHTPQLSGQSAVIESGFFSHSPSRALGEG